MKKLTVFLMLLLCASFSKISAQNDIRWELNCSGSMGIYVNGVLEVSYNSGFSSGPNYGIIHDVPVGADIQVIAVTQGMIHPIICDDSPEMIEAGLQPYVEFDYYWPEYGRDSCNEEFVMPDIDMYVGIGIS